MRWFWRLVSCVRALGLCNGWRYWRLQRAAEREPDLPLLWAFRCKIEANERELSGDERMASVLRRWAAELEAQHEKRRADNVKDEPRGGL